MSFSYAFLYRTFLRVYVCRFATFSTYNISLLLTNFWIDWESETLIYSNLSLNCTFCFLILWQIMRYWYLYLCFCDYIGSFNSLLWLHVLAYQILQDQKAERPCQPWSWPYWQAQETSWRSWKSWWLDTSQNSLRQIVSIPEFDDTMIFCLGSGVYRVEFCFQTDIFCVCEFLLVIHYFHTLCIFE